MHREKMVGGNLREGNVEAVSELWTERIDFLVGFIVVRTLQRERYQGRMTFFESEIRTG